MSEWQPIETAPRDGSKVLAYDPGWCGGTMAIARWWDGEFRTGNLPGEEMYPTHWMPLPPPPDGT